MNVNKIRKTIKKVFSYHNASYQKTGETYGCDRSDLQYKAHILSVKVLILTSQFLAPVLSIKVLILTKSCSRSVNKNIDINNFSIYCSMLGMEEYEKLEGVLLSLMIQNIDFFAKICTVAQINAWHFKHKIHHFHILLQSSDKEHNLNFA